MSKPSSTLRKLGIRRSPEQIREAPQGQPQAFSGDTPQAGTFPSSGIAARTGGKAPRIVEKHAKNGTTTTRRPPTVKGKR